MKKTTITISKNLRNRIRHSKNVTACNYEDFLSRLMDRDTRYNNEEKNYHNKDKINEEIKNGDTKTK